MMDCEMYYRMEKAHGQPIFLHDDLVTNRVHEGQISMQTYNSVDYADKMEKKSDTVPRSIHEKSNHT